MTKKVLWVSMRAPYDGVKHAGGKNHNYQVKGFAKNPCYDITLITECFEEETDIVKSECENSNIKLYFTVNYKSGIKKYLRKLLNAESVLNPFNRYAGLTMNSLIYSIKRQLNILTKNGYYPDIIILQWTQVNLLAPFFKKRFPKSVLIEIEEDVAFLGYHRHFLLTKKSCVWKAKYNKLKKKELYSLGLADLVVVNNVKDYNLLIDNEFKKDIFVLPPFYQRFDGIERRPAEKITMLFYGAMYRQENYRSVIWFIEKVCPLIDDIDYDFFVIGSNPPKDFFKFESSRIHIKGFVEDLTDFFSKVSFMVAPLILGAGIKIKVLEAFASGIPVITNTIGIEGIPATSGIDYMHAQSPEDYSNWIHKIDKGMVDLESMSSKEKTLVRDVFDYDKSLSELQERILKMVN